MWYSRARPSSRPMQRLWTQQSRGVRVQATWILPKLPRSQDGRALAPRLPYFLILDLATFLCSLQTMPNTGAAGFVQPGTGHSCFFRAGADAEARVKGAVVAGCCHQSPPFGAVKAWPFQGTWRDF